MFDTPEYMATVPISITVTVDGIDHPLTLDVGTSLRRAALDFCAHHNVVDVKNTVPVLEQALIAEANKVFNAQQASSTSNDGVEGARDELAGSRAGFGLAAPTSTAEISVNINGATRTCQQLSNESAPEAARRFCIDNGLDKDEEYDSVLRLLVNRLRGAVLPLDQQDDLPRTGDVTRTIAIVDVNTGDGSGRLLKMRVLEGESPVEAARGFLERTGFDADNLDRLARMAAVRVAEAVNAADAGAGSTPAAFTAGTGTASGGGGATANDFAAGGDGSDGGSSLPELIDPREGITLKVNFDGASSSTTLSSLTLVYRYTENPTAAAAAFLRGAGLTPQQGGVADEDKYNEYLNAIVSGINERARFVRGTLAAESRQNGAAQGGSLQDSISHPGPLVISPVSTTVPLQVGSLSYDLRVTKGANLRALSRAACAQEWSSIRPQLEAAVEDAAGTGAGASVATQDTCAAVLYDVLSTYVTALVAEYQASSASSSAASSSANSGSSNSNQTVNPLPTELSASSPLTNSDIVVPGNAKAAAAMVMDMGRQR